jgi:SulP family sulfate permease
VFAAVTTIAVLVFGMLIGVGVAVIASLFDVARRAMTPATSTLVRVPNSDRYSDIAEHPDGESTPGLAIYRFDAPLFFANVDQFIEDVEALIASGDPAPGAVLVSAEAITDLDVTALDAIIAYVVELRERGVGFAVARLKSDLRDALDRAGATTTLRTPTTLRSMTASRRTDPEASVGTRVGDPQAGAGRTSKGCDSMTEGDPGRPPSQ